MDVLINKLVSCNFSRTRNQVGKPCIINCVPGAGKSTLIRELLNSDSRFRAYTFGEADPKNLSGRRILPASELRNAPQGALIIIDEYTEGSWEPGKICAAFGDPIQLMGARHCLTDFVCNKTKRFGNSTCELLNSFGFEIYSEKEDICLVRDFFEVEPEGTVVAFESEVKDILARHFVEFEDICSIRGKTFEEVTFFTASNSIPEHLAGRLLPVLNPAQKQAHYCLPRCHFRPLLIILRLS
ncbi:triple block protein 1 [Poplar mosaic virus]|uniref:Triple block protein 1 n=1 Tax=Poplar mosaic virus TaxID=12166 RepID=Q6RBY8_9VIRU|nr:triple block protein 1 [Poplar mosaic virus]AAR89415.1 triple block protein 1 [Poplar mosaic virus]